MVPSHDLRRCRTNRRQGPDGLPACDARPVVAHANHGGAASVAPSTRGSVAWVFGPQSRWRRAGRAGRPRCWNQPGERLGEGTVKVPGAAPHAATTQPRSRGGRFSANWRGPAKPGRSSRLATARRVARGQARCSRSMRRRLVRPSSPWHGTRRSGTCVLRCREDNAYRPRLHDASVVGTMRDGSSTGSPGKGGTDRGCRCRKLRSQGTSPCDRAGRAGRGACARVRTRSSRSGGRRAHARHDEGLPCPTPSSRCRFACSSTVS
jgi:hypothetical protein